MPKLNEQQQLQVRDLYLQGIPQRKIADQFDVPRYVIADILRGHGNSIVKITKEERASRPRLGYKVALEDYPKIKEMALARATAKEIAEKFKVSRRTIVKILNGVSGARLGAVPPWERVRKKLSMIQMHEIKSKYEAGMKPKEIAPAYSITPAHVSRLVAGTRGKGFAKAEKDPLCHSRFSAAQIQEIIKRSRSETKSALARAFKCSPNAINYILKKHS